MQLHLFNNEKSHDKIVNVASVPQRSPFRYPGGKTWLIPHIRQWLRSLPQRPTVLVEPFAGGAIVGLTAAAESLVDHVELIELDEEVAAVWQVIFQSPEDAEWFAARIMSFEMNGENVKAILAEESNIIRERAFRTIVKNRVNRGGILAPGAGLIKAGEDGKGLTSRWYPQTLSRRILEIAANRHKISFTQGDALQILTYRTWDSNNAFFIDPPYTTSKHSAGSRLYKYSVVDHTRLFELAANLPGYVLMTYDDTEEVRDLAAAHGFVVERIPMKNRHHTTKMELLITKRRD